MYTKLINTMKNLPEPYETSETEFWNDKHISESMLKNHLEPESDGATRNYDFINKSVDWISSLSVPGNKLLDLGCGPGIYAEKLHDKGYQVTGIDFSHRSIEYARKSAESSQKNIEYIYQNYMDINYTKEFDIVMIIYCDLGVLSFKDRSLLLEKIYKALSPGGIFIADVFSSKQYKDFTDEMTVTFEEEGFWRSKPYLCIKRNNSYKGNIYLEQYTIISEQEEQTYNLWNHAFTQREIMDNIKEAGFSDVKLYGDASGTDINSEGTTICAVGKK